MRKKREDQVLLKVLKGDPLSKPELEVTEKLIRRGMVVREENSFALTDYGKFIQREGYRTYEESEKFERELYDINPAKIKALNFFLFLFFLLFLAVLLSIVWFDLEAVFVFLVRSPFQSIGNFKPMRKKIDICC